MNFQRRTFVVKSQDRTSGTTTDFLYKLPMQLRDVVHVNLQHAIVENGVFNVTSENNKFVLNQLKNNPLTDSSGSGSGGDAYTDFAFKGNAVKIIVDGDGNTQLFGLGKGGNALLTAEIPTYPSPILWSAIQPNNIPFSETGNISELKCIGYTDTTNGGLGTIIVGGDLMRSGLPSQLLRSIDGGVTFDYVPIGIGMPANSVNAIGWGLANSVPTWFMVGEDGTSGVKNKFEIDGTNDTLTLTLNSTPTTAVIPHDVYSKSALVDAVNVAIASALAGTPTASGKLTLTSNPYFNFEYTNPSTFSHISNTADEKLVGSVTLPANGSANAVFTWNYRMTRGDSGSNQAYRWFIRRMDGTLVSNSGFLTSSGSPVPVDYIESNSISFGDFQYNGGEVLQLWFQPVYGGSYAKNVGFKISLQQQDSGTAYFMNTSTDTSVIATLIAGNPLGTMLGVLTDVEFTTIGAPAQEKLTPNVASTYPLWTSIDDGLTWNPLLVEKSVDSDSSYDFGGFSMNINADNKIILGTDEGLLIADLDTYTTKWSVIDKDSSGTFLGTITAMDYAVGSPSATFVFGNSAGTIYQIKSTDTAEIGATFPTPTKLTSLVENPNGNVGVPSQVKLIKFTGILDNVYPTWIMGGSSLCYSTSTTNDITQITLVPFNSSTNASNFPELEPINGLEYDVATKTCIIVGTPIGEYTCSNYTNTKDLTNWIVEKEYLSNKLIQIPVGYYNDTYLTSTLQTLLNDNVVPDGGAFYVELLSNGKIVITNTSVSNWAIRFSNGNIQYTGTAFLLGFLDLDRYYAPLEFDTGLSSSFIQSDMDGGLNLSSYEYVCIQSDKFGNDMMTNKGTAFWWFVPNVSNGVNSTSIVYENTRNPTLEYLRIPRDIEQFDIRVIDQNGKIIQVADQKNVTIVIEFYLKTTCYPR